jgi:hypothetical protein
MRSRFGPTTLHASCAAVLLLTMALATARAATPREELLRHVPEDVAFCMAIQDLRGHAAAFDASPFAKKLRDSPFGQAFTQSDDLRKLLAFDKDLRDKLGVNFNKLGEDIFGDALVFAYRPGPPDKPDAEQGLFLLRARDAKLLTDVVDLFNEWQKNSGDLKEIEEREYHGTTYFRRADKKDTNFYFVRDGVLAFSGQEAMLKAAIDHNRDASSDRVSPVDQQFRLARADKALVALWVNPRAFDVQMERKAKSAPAADAAVLRNLLIYWKALDSVVLTADLQKDFELKLCVRARVDELPPAARKFIAEAAKPSELWDRFPPDAMLGVASRFDLAALVEVVQAFLPAEVNKSFKDAIDRGFGSVLGPDLVSDVLPHVSPDWGFYVAAPPTEEKAWFPRTVFALRVRPGDKKPPVDRTMLDAINFYAGVAVLSQNQKKDAAPLSLKTVEQDKVEVKYLSGGELPPGLQPAYALDNGYLLLASSPEAMRQFHNAAPASPASSEETPLLRMSCMEIRRFVKERREPLAAAVAEKNQITKDDASKRLDVLLTVLDWVDRVELTQRPEKGQVTFTLRVQTALPLK